MRRQLALALARAGEVDEAREVLRDLLVAVPPDGETVALIGRLNKDLAGNPQVFSHNIFLGVGVKF